MGNLGSIKKMLLKIGADSIITSKPEDIQAADKLILPGVGAFDKAMANLEKLSIIPLLSSQVLEKKKMILGICLGMQLFTKGSEEGEIPGLGWIDAETVKFNFNDNSRKLKIPHMGGTRSLSSKTTRSFIIFTKIQNSILCILIM